MEKPQIKTVRGSLLSKKENSIPQRKGSSNEKNTHSDRFLRKEDTSSLAEDLLV